MIKIINVGNRIMNTYVYHSNHGYVMIDTGYEHSLKNVEKKLNKNNIQLEDIEYVFLTHAHDDHAGFLNELLYKNNHLKVIMSDKAMPTLKKGQNSFDGGCSTMLAWVFCKCMGLFGKSKHLFPIIEDKFNHRFIEITKENQFELEKILQGKILITPGHTKDSISLKMNKIVFCGDAAMNNLPSTKRFTIWIEDKEQYEQSWNQFIEEKVEVIYPAHGKSFSISDLIKYKNEISKIKLYKLNK